MVAAAEKAEQQYAAQEAEKLLTNTPDAVKKKSEVLNITSSVWS